MSGDTGIDRVTVGHVTVELDDQLVVALALTMSLDKQALLARVLFSINEAGYGAVELVLADGKVQNVKETRSYR